MVFSMVFEMMFGDLWKYIWGFMFFSWILQGCLVVFGDELEEFKVTFGDLLGVDGIFVGILIDHDVI